MNGAMPAWTWLDHPLVGTRRWLSAVGAAYCIVTALGTALALGMYAGGVELLPGWTVRLLDGYTAALIIAGVLSATVLPTLYGLANGGPAMAAAIGLTPQLAGGLLYLDYTLTNDLVVALIAAAVGAVVAVGTAWYRAGSVPTDIEDAPDRLDGLLVATGLTVVALAAAVQFDRGAPADVLATVDPFHWLVSIAVLGCLSLWLAVAVARR